MEIEKSIFWLKKAKRGKGGRRERRFLMEEFN
jgi:hypothetical protein